MSLITERHADGTILRQWDDGEQLDDLPIPDPVTEPTAPVAMLIAALRDPLADLTPSSASTTVRTVILNQRAALDALLAALETP